MVLSITIHGKIIKMKKTLLFILFLASSCATIKNLKTGCYEAKNENLLIYNYIELKTDSTYYFYAKGDIYRTSLEGRWRVHGDQLILNSNIQPETNGYFTEFEDNNATKFQVILYDINKNPIKDQTHVFIKQDSNYFSLTNRSDNIYLIDKNKLKDEFTVGSGSNYKEFNVHIKNKSSNKIIVFLVPDTKGFFQTNKHFAIKDSLSFSSKKFIFTKIKCNRD